MAVGSGNSQMPHHLLRWAQMSFPAFVSPLVPLRAPAKAFRNLLCRTWTPCQVPPPLQELQKENPLWHIKGKDDHFPSNSQIISEMQREKSTAEFRKAQLLLLSRTDTAPSEASTNRQGSKGSVRTGTTKHWCLFLCAPSTRCWRKGFFSDGEEKEEKWWSSRSWRIRNHTPLWKNPRTVWVGRDLSPMQMFNSADAMTEPWGTQVKIEAKKVIEYLSLPHVLGNQVSCLLLQRPHTLSLQKLFLLPLMTGQI